MLPGETAVNLATQAAARGYVGLRFVGDHLPVVMGGSAWLARPDVSF
jgi:hypothetical protein